MRSPIVFLFSGQGSQYYQMGRDLYKECSLFQENLQAVDAMCINSHLLPGFSLIAHIFDDRYSVINPFDQTLYTHPSIFLFELALAFTLIKMELIPSLVVGYSAGEFAAAVIANLMTPREGLALVVKHAKIFEEKCERGSMLAVFASDKIYQTNLELQKLGELAAINLDDHFVLSGKKNNLEIAKKILAAKNITFAELAVSHPFHSSLVETVKTDFLGIGLTMTSSHSPLKFYSSTTGCEVKTLTVQHFWEVVRKPVLFRHCATLLEKKGDAVYIDVGPSGTLATFMKRLLPSAASRIFSTVTPYGRSFTKIKEINRKVSYNFAKLSTE